MLAVDGEPYNSNPGQRRISMEISPRTKINELLFKYPFLKDFLIGLDPHFKALNNPFMMKTIGRVASLNKVSLITGYDLEKLVRAIASEISKKTGEQAVVTLKDAPQEEAESKKRLEILKGIMKDLPGRFLPCSAT